MVAFQIHVIAAKIDYLQISDTIEYLKIIDIQVLHVYVHKVDDMG